LNRRFPYVYFYTGYIHTIHLMQAKRSHWKASNQAFSRSQNRVDLSLHASNL
jgi:hypothetical protein